MMLMRKPLFVKILIENLRSLKFDLVIQVSKLSFSSNKCFGCGYHGEFKTQSVLSQALVTEWELDNEYEHFFSQREGTCCRHCGCSLRASSLAVGVSKVLADLYGVTGDCLHTIVRKLRNSIHSSVTIAEINSAGSLHQFLRNVPSVIYTEYGSTTIDVRSEDIQRMTFGDSSIDMVVTSEVLEHVPDTGAALTEIHRVLVPKGFHVFTVPIHPQRSSSKCRALIKDNQLVHLYAPSYHGLPGNRKDDYLVFHEFGNDIYDLILASGFVLERVMLPNCSNPTVFCLVTRKA